MAHITEVTDLRIAVLTSDQVFRLIQDLETTPRGPIRIGIDGDGIKIDVGYGWGPGIGRLANEAGR